MAEQSHLSGSRPATSAPARYDGNLARMRKKGDAGRSSFLWLRDYERDSAEQKRQGLFPLAIRSYGDQADIRYAAIWVRYRAP